MKLHENKTLFQDAVVLAAQQKKGLSETVIEKDYWVTLALYTIFKNEIGNETVFKGGTSLSKCFQLIERFSEDIDLVVFRRDGESGNKMKEKITKIGKCVEKVMPEIYVEGKTNKMGMNRTTVHLFDHAFPEDLKHVNNNKITLEATWLGNVEPHTESMIQSYISEMMYYQNQTELIEAYNMQPFPFKVLAKERTFCEKIMSLVKFSFSENPIVDLNYKVRHIYDIHKLLHNEEINQFFNSLAFNDMLLKVGNDDLISYRNRNTWLRNHPSTAMLFSDTTNTWNQISKTYNSEFKEEMVFGDLPSDNDILDTLHEVANRLKSIKWTIEL
jgi:predicted nucleotidyltransferase component of viral defense system